MLNNTTNKEQIIFSWFLITLSFIASSYHYIALVKYNFFLALFIAVIGCTLITAIIFSKNKILYIISIIVIFLFYIGSMLHLY